MMASNQNWDVALKNFKSARYIDPGSMIHTYCLEKNMK